MKKIILAGMLCFTVLLVACQTAETPPEPTVTEIPTATAAPEPTAAATQEPTATVTPTPEPTVGKTLEALKAEALASGNLCAAAYLGYIEGSYAEFITFLKENGSLEQFPFLKDIPEENVVTASGGEWYVLVPAGENVSFTVCESMLDETTYMLVAGRELLRPEAGECVILCGNVSDIFPSFLVTVTAPENTIIEYGPGLSLRDGALNVVDGVYDFTVYAEGQLEE